MKKGYFTLTAVVLSAGLFIGCTRNEAGDTSKRTELQSITTEAEIFDDEGDYDEDCFVNSHFIYEVDYGDESEEEGECFLLQKKPDGTVVNKIHFDKLSLLSSKGEYVEILGVTDNEIICIDEEDEKYEKGALYCIPLSYKEGKEEVLWDKKEKVYTGNSDEITCLNFFSCVGDYILCDDGEGHCIEYNRKTHEPVTIETDQKEAYGYFYDYKGESYGTGEYLLCTRYTGDREQGIYVHRAGTRTAERMTENNAEGTLIVSGNGKFYFTCLMDEEKQSLYDLWVFDCEKNEVRKLLSREQIEKVLPEQPPAVCDLIQEIKLAEGKIYMEVRYAGNVHVISYNEDTKELRLEQDIRELVHHREYKLERAVQDGNSKYTCCNDRNLYISNQFGNIEERKTDGTYIRTIHLRGGTFCYANEDELILQYYDKDGTGILYSVPFVQIDGMDYPDVNRKRKITRVGEYKDELIWDSNLYADSEYLVYITNDHEFKVFDRQKQSFVKLENDPQANHTFGGNSIMDNRIGDCFVFNTKPFGEKENQYGFSYYRLGDKKVTRIDSKCFTAASYVCDKSRNRIIYERLPEKETENQEYEWWSYDIKSGEKKYLFSESELNKTAEENGISVKMGFGDFCFLYEDHLYQAGEDGCLSWNLNGKEKLQFEKEITETVREKENQYVTDYIGFVEGKLLYQNEGTDGEREQEQAYCYDFETREEKKLTVKEPEYLYQFLTDNYFVE